MVGSLAENEPRLRAHWQADPWTAPTALLILGVGWLGVGCSLFDIKDVDRYTWKRSALALAVETDAPRERFAKDPEPNTYGDWWEGRRDGCFQLSAPIYLFSTWWARRTREFEKAIGRNRNG